MVAALVILDGAAEPPLPVATTLESAATPALDALCLGGAVGRVATTPAGLPAGSETGIPALLGASPAAAVGRGRVEAAAAGIGIPTGHGAWRLDLHLPGGERACARGAAALVPLLRRRLPHHAVHHLRGHRLLAVGPHASLEPGDGAALPATLDERTTVVCGPGAAAGCAAQLGARVVRPAGATGDVDTDLEAKLAAAVAALAPAELVVVHVGGPDEAAHRRDAAGKRAAVEAADGRLVGPLATAVAHAGGRIAVTCDHATCVSTGRHDGSPVPVVAHGPGIAPAGPDRLTERATAATRVQPGPWPLEVAA